jgi:protein-S-isoprenylcysteine O-methyltransferase Ste14
VTPERAFQFKIGMGVFMMLAAYDAASGRFDLWPGWCYAAFFLCVFTASYLVLRKVAPDLVVERTSWGAEVKSWDRPIVMLLSFGPILTPLVAGLDARWHGVGSPDIRVVIGYALGLAGSGLTHWAMATNRFYAPVVRIQKERGHQVVDQGPYRMVRHPGNLGNVLLNAAAPLMLASRWAWIPAGAFIALTLVRTALEDRTLITELPGYAEFAHRTSHRMIPGVW